jgi:hypothetical protein
MDSMFFRTTESGKPGRKTTATIESTLANVSAMLATLKRYRGTAALDWHEYTSFPARQEREFWGRAYLEILELLAHDDDVAVVSYNDLLSARPS